MLGIKNAKPDDSAAPHCTAAKMFTNFNVIPSTELNTL
jgi:hypothetical protein